VDSKEASKDEADLCSRKEDESEVEECRMEDTWLSEIQRKTVISELLSSWRKEKDEKVRRKKAEDLV
jgi:hypothetical protein